jgi:hypothetical protein
LAITFGGDPSGSPPNLVKLLGFVRRIESVAMIATILFRRELP